MTRDVNVANRGSVGGLWAALEAEEDPQERGIEALRSKRKQGEEGGERRGGEGPLWRETLGRTPG